MKRLMEKTVFCGLVTACRLATVPTSRSPLCVNATTEGVTRPPSAFSITVGSPPSSTAMQLLVVPRSIPIVFAISSLLLCVPVRENLSGSVADLRCRLGGLNPDLRTHPPERAVGAGGAAGVARASPVTEQIEVQLELLAGRREREHGVMQLLKRRAGTEQPEPRPHARDMGVDRNIAHAEGEQQHAGGGLASHPRQRAEIALGVGHGALCVPAERQLAAPVTGRDLLQDRLDPG